MTVRLLGLDQTLISQNILTIEYLQWFKGASARLLPADARPGCRFAVTVRTRGMPAIPAANDEEALVCSGNDPTTSDRRGGNFIARDGDTELQSC